MTLFATKSFAGQAPRVAVRQLADNMAEHAVNCKLWRTLEPFRDTLQVKAAVNTPGVLNTIYPFGQSMIGDVLVQSPPYIGSALGGSAIGAVPPLAFTSTAMSVDSLIWADWAKDVDVVRGAVPGDISERTYYTGDGAPKMTTIQLAAPAYTGGPVPRTSFPLGIAAPTNTPTVTPGAGGSGVAQDISYVYTFVSIFGEESAPSPPSTIAVLLPGQAALIGNLSGSGFGANMASQRIYRTNTGTNGATEFQFVAEITLLDTSFNDTVLSADLGEVLPTEGWLPPPANLIGLTSMPNGVVAGFYDNTACLCEPWKPYAYPIRYQYAAEFPIVGLGSFGNSVAVLTVGNPYLLTGVDPGTMSMSKLPTQQPCASKRSIVNMGFGVAYASPDGLIIISNNGVQNITESHLTRDEWQQLNPTTLHGYMLDGRYFGFYKTTTAIPWLPAAIQLQGGFIFDPMNAQDGLVFVDTYATAGYADLITDALYLLVGSNIVKWDAGATFKTLLWKSKTFEANKPVNLSYGQVIAAAYPVTMRVYADGVLKHTKAVASSNAFRLPSGFKARFWSYEVEGTAEVYSALITDSMEAIKNV